MTDDPNTTEMTVRGGGADYRLTQSEEAPLRSPLAMAHGVLRGRYRWAIGLGVLLAIAGGIAGFRLSGLTYQSTGLIEVAINVPRILYSTDNNGKLDYFDAYMDSQAQLASSRRVVSMAMESPEWARFGRGMSDQAILDFYASFWVGRSSRAQFITVSFSDPDPEVATVAVTQVIKAYMRLVEERDATSGLARVRALETQRTSLNGKLKNLEQDAMAVTEGIGAEGLRERNQFVLQELNKLDAAMNECDLELARLKDPKPAEAEHVLSEEEIGRVDSGMRGLLDQKADALAQIEFLKADGLLENHPQMQAANRSLETIERRIAQTAVEFRAARATAGQSADLTEIQAKRSRVIALRASMQAEAKRIGEKRAALLQIDQDKRLCTQQLEDVKRTLDAINVEGEVQGRISVVSYGDRPLGPAGDKRATRTVLGSIGGLTLGFGIVLLWGLREARVRHIDDVDERAHEGRFLGMVPDLSDRGDTAAGATADEMGDFCVHHVRTMLQLRAAGRPAVVALTSPSPGDGKTMLGLALGMSFAATGSRTLLVDCDMVGHGLTTAMRSLVCSSASKALLASAGGDPESGDAGRPNGADRPLRITDLLDARTLRFDDAQVRELLEACRTTARERPALLNSVRALEGLARSLGEGGLREQ